MIKIALVKSQPHSPKTHVTGKSVQSNNKYNQKIFNRPQKKKNRSIANPWTIKPQRFLNRTNRASFFENAYNNSQVNGEQGERQTAQQAFINVRASRRSLRGDPRVYANRVRLARVSRSSPTSLCANLANYSSTGLITRLAFHPRTTNDSPLWPARIESRDAALSSRE